MVKLIEFVIFWSIGLYLMNKYLFSSFFIHGGLQNIGSFFILIAFVIWTITVGVVTVAKKEYREEE